MVTPDEDLKAALLKARTLEDFLDTCLELRVTLRPRRGFTFPIRVVPTRGDTE